MQTTLLTLGITLILALVTALVGPAFVDWGRFRTNFEAQASRLAGQSVRISGPISVRLLPIPMVRLQGIDVGPPAAKATMSAREINAQLSLPSLMRGQVRAAVLRVDAPRFALQRDAQGRVAGPPLVASDVTIDHIVVHEGRIRVTDAASAAGSVVDHWSFDGDVRAPNGPIRGEGAFVVEDQTYNYRIQTSRGSDGGIKLRLGVDPADRPLSIESEGTLSFEDGAPHYDGSLKLARPAGLALSSGQTVASDPWQVSSKLKIDTSAALFDQVDFQYGPDERAVHLTGTADLQFGGGARINAVLTARQIDLDRALVMTDPAARRPAATVRGLLETLGGVRLPLPLTVGIGIDAVTLGGGMVQSVRADLSADAKAVSIDTLEFRAPGYAQVRLSGRLDAAQWEFAGPIALDAPDPKTLLAWLDGIELPNLPIGALALRADVALSRARLALDQVKATYDRKDYAGRIAYRFTTARDPARLDVGITASQFDADAAIALARLFSAGAASTGATFEWPGEIGIAADLGRVTLAGVGAKDASARLEFDRSGLRIESLTIADFGGAALTAAGRIDTPTKPSGGTLNLDLNVERIDGLVAAARLVSPEAADWLRANAAGALPAKLDAGITIDPTPSGGTKSLGKVKLMGTARGIAIAVTGQGLGDLTDPRHAELHLEGDFQSDDGALLTALGFDGLARENRAGSLIWTVDGPVAGDMAVNAKLSGPGLEARADGKVRLADVGLQGNGTAMLSLADVPALRREAPFPLTARARLAVDGREIGFAELDGKAGPSSVRGQGKLVLGDPLRVDANLTADQVDVPAMIASVIGIPPQGSATADWPRQPFQPWSKVAGRIVLRAPQALLTPSLSATAVRGNLTLAPGDIAFEGLSGSIAGGTLSADLRFHGAQGALAVHSRISLANANLPALLDGGASPPLAGRISGKLEMDGTASNPSALIASLSGSGSVSVENLQIAGIDQKAIEIASRAFERGTAVTPARISDTVGRMMEQGSLGLPWVTAPLTVAAGRIRLGKLVTPSQNNELAASGSFDLMDSMLDARLTLSTTSDTGQRPEVSVVLKGPVGAVRRTLDVAALTNYLTLRSADRETKQIEAAQRAAKQLEKLNPSGAGQQPGSAQTPAAPRNPSSGPDANRPDVRANLPVEPVQPQTAPALPPPVTLTRPPGSLQAKPAPPFLTAPPLFTPQ
ncbi:MAG: AsmA family protein [Xanthobacteraceae bacterium]|nr:AsmA family protein [Xanthobacteraceae bacterium]